MPVTFEHHDHIKGPFYHGTKASVTPGELLIPGYGSNFEEGRASNNIYFTGTLDAAVWGAELARGEGAGRIYIVEPTGPFEDDLNLTNKRFPGNPTRSYRTRDPLRVTGEVREWEGHPPDVLQSMRDHLAELERQGLAVIDD
ncbi:MAG: NAD(+)--rifampin ADP-ribosyltransferase [Anaerosomatales bacterium]|nr:NAD(+)--rifampin ADP-ribosyltransferase [Anaerosomatales bacterium]